MNRTELRFIKRAVKRQSAKLEGAPSDVIESFMVDAIMDAINDAQDELAGELGAEVGVVEPGKLPQPPGLFDRKVKDWRDSSAAAMPDADPETQPKSTIAPVQQKSMLILPGQEGFESAKAQKLPVGTVEPLQLFKRPKPGEVWEQGEFSEKWQLAISALVELIGEKMPQGIKLTPVGASSPIVIDRLNIQSDVTSGSVKVEYGIKGQTGSSKSSPNIGGGALDAMRIDLVVHQQFNIEDKTVNWEQRIQDVVAQSEVVFRPRSPELVNHTPVKTGSVEMLLSGDMRQNAGGYVDFDKSGTVLVVDSADTQRRNSQAGKVYLPPL